MFGDLFGPKCDGEYISDLFETFEVDLEWSEMVFDTPQISKKCHIFMFLDHDFGPKFVGMKDFGPIVSDSKTSWSKLYVYNLQCLRISCGFGSTVARSYSLKTYVFRL